MNQLLAYCVFVLCVFVWMCLLYFLQQIEGWGNTNEGITSCMMFFVLCVSVWGCMLYFKQQIGTATVKESRFICCVVL